MSYHNNRGALLATAIAAVQALRANAGELTIAHHQQVNLMSAVLEKMAPFYELPAAKKVVAYYGRAYLLEREVTHIATDGDGTVYTYHGEPEFSVIGSSWYGDGADDIDHRTDLTASSSLVEV